MLCMTDPPIVADIALLVARRFRVPLVVISQDVFPEIAVQLKRLENPAVMSVAALARLALSPSGRPHRRDRRHDAAAPRGKGSAAGTRARDSELDRHAAATRRRSGTTGGRRERGCDEQVRGHALGQRRPRAGSRLARPRRRRSLRDLDDLAIMIIGMGARHAELVALAELLEVDQVKFLVLPAAPTSAAVAVGGRRACRRARLRAWPAMSFRAGCTGSSRSRRPVIVAADAESETAQVVAAGRLRHRRPARKTRAARACDSRRS